VSIPRVIAIDGPAAAGKTTVGRELAARLGWLFFDTGILYRVLTYLAHQRGVAVTDGDALAALAAEMDASLVRGANAEASTRVEAGGIDLTDVLRTAAIDRDVSTVAAHGLVRAALVEPQRNAIGSRPAVVVGRDIGTVIFPQAPLKIYLDASPAERARRRVLELDKDAAGEEKAAIATDLMRRDSLDRSRSSAPLARASDSLLFETDGIGATTVVERILEAWQDRDRKRRGETGTEGHDGSRAP
jgi:cytidylate kinase